MSFFDAGYLAAQEVVKRHSSAVIALSLLALLLASSGIASLRLDLSFRPLFASGAEVAEPTEKFEAVFGQSSGAWIITVLENDGATKGDFIRAAAQLSKRALLVAGINEVLSLTSIQIPQWHSDSARLSLITPLPGYLLEPDAEAKLAYQYDQLLDATRFVNWLVSADGTKLLLAGRLDLPLDDLAGRRQIVQDFEVALRNEAPEYIRLHFSGVSVVELAYARQVLRDQIIATTITSGALMLLLWLTLGNMRLVLACLTPVTLAIPATLGVMGWLGQPVTIINTVIPAIVLVIGVADAVHMLNAWLEARTRGETPHSATHSMLSTTGKACFFTTLTTMGGFAALANAQLESVGNFGISAAIGIGIAWLANQALLPWMLRRFNLADGLAVGRVNRMADYVVAGMLQYAAVKSRYMLAAGLLFTIGCGILIPSLKIDQRFNEELPVTHPVTQSQNILEYNFGGFLGPEISIRRRDGGSLLDDNSQQKLSRFVGELKQLPGTHHVWSIQDLLPQQEPFAKNAEVLDKLRETPATRQRVRELISEHKDQLAVIVRIGDIGTERAANYRDEILRLAKASWGEDIEVEIVGQWWLAQHGMRLLLHDMLTSLITAMIIVLPLMWFALREARLFIAAALANVLPLLLPLAFMAITGISLRIGTAVVLALALGIVVDNTLHIIIRLRAGLKNYGPIATQLPNVMQSTGRAIVFTTLALVGGFLSMLSNELLAIRDMGLVAAVTIFGAMLADLLFLPAVYVVICREDAKQ